MAAITALPNKFDLSTLLKKIKEACDQYNLNAETQIMLAHRPQDVSSPNRWTRYAGTLKDVNSLEMIADTSEFSELDAFFKGCVIEEIVDEVRGVAQQMGKNIGRIRILTLKPKTCYSLHRDTDEFRFHIPLVTNKSSFFVYDSEVGYMPEVGRLYLFKTEDLHTAVNAAMKKKRVHLVFDTY
jgi:hypothetical protein